MALYLKERSEFKSLNDPIVYFFCADYGAQSTYVNKSCFYIHLQCHHGRMRSFSDVFELCKTYFPKCTKKEVAYHLLNDFVSIAWYCTDLKKVVFGKHGEDEKENEFDREMCGNYGLGKKGIDGYSYSKIKSLANLYKKTLK